MGLERFTNFILKSNNLDEINIDNNIKKIVSNHIVFDLNFLIYQEMVNIENEVNDIIKIILSLPFAPKNDILEKLLKKILSQKHWNTYYIETELQKLFDGFNENEIIENFIKFLYSKKQLEEIKSNNLISILELIIYEKITNVLINYIENIHYSQFIQSILIFYDGIPSMSKVIEQRKRRIKNFIESTEKKKIFNKYFDKLISNNKNLFKSLSKNYLQFENNNIISFDYFKWIKNRFTIDKSISPSSEFMTNLELFMSIKIKQKYPKKHIFINSAKENGESDLKIFKYISLNDIDGDYCIHTTDSDLIHQTIVQQTYYKIIGKEINFNVIKYIKNYQSKSDILGYAQILESNKIIKNILDLYNSINKIKTNNYKIIWDLCLIFYLFGSDHLPSSVEIGPELGLDFFIKSHYKSLNKSNIVNIKKNYITMNLLNLKIYLEKINETKYNNITRIIFQRFFKINNNLINLFIDNLNLNFEQTLIFLKVFITILGNNMEQIDFELLDDSDLRKQFVKLDPEKHLIKLDEINNFTNFTFNDEQINLIIDNSNLIEENINFYEKEFNGLILYSKPQYIDSDSYQDIYNFISEKAKNNTTKQYPLYYNYLDIYNYLKIIDKLDNK